MVSLWQFALCDTIRLSKSSVLVSVSQACAKTCRLVLDSVASESRPAHPFPFKTFCSEWYRSDSNEQSNDFRLKAAFLVGSKSFYSSSNVNKGDQLLNQEENCICVKIKSLKANSANGFFSSIRLNLKKASGSISLFR